MHPVRTHTTPKVKCIDNVNLDTAHYSTVHSDADRHGICLLDGAWQGIFLLDTLYQGIFLLDITLSGHFPSGRTLSAYFRSGCTVSGYYLLEAAVSGQMVFGRRVLWEHGHVGCQGTEYRSKYSGHIRKHAAGSKHSDSHQFYSLYLWYIYLYMLRMYIYICYICTSIYATTTLRVSSTSTQRHTHRCNHDM